MRSQGHDPRPLANSPLHYLRRTRAKGRQLSWQWCWQSLVDHALVATTAPAFLALIEPFLDGAVERLLAVTVLTREEAGWRIANTHVWREPELATVPELAAPYELKRQRRWLDAIRRAGADTKENPNA